MALAWLLSNWKLVVVAVLFAALGGYALTMKLERDAARNELAEYRTKIAQAAVEAAEAALKKTIEDEKRKEKNDVENARLTAALADTTRKLRDARSGSSFVPTAASCPGRPDDAAFNRAELERALRAFDSDLQGIVDEGSKAVIDLDTAKRWAQDR